MTNAPNDLTILVSGATGQQGGAVARHLLQKRFRVRTLTRNPKQEAVSALADEGAEIVEGNFDDRASLDAALDGVYGAFSVQGFFEEGVEAETRQGNAFADAAKDAGIEHFIYSSVAGAERKSGVPHFESKWAIEEHIRTLGLPVTIFRPVWFMDNWAAFSGKTILEDGTLAQPLRPSTKLQQIAVDDIGAFVALAFSDPDTWVGRELELAGDELTMAETAAGFSRVLGRPVEYVQVPWDAFEAQIGEELTEMYRWFKSDGFEADIEALRREHPGLKRLEPFLREQGWARTDAQMALAN